MLIRVRWVSFSVKNSKIFIKVFFSPFDICGCLKINVDLFQKK